MSGLMRLLVITIQFANPMTLEAGTTLDSIGRMPEVVVTAPRYYGADTNYVGVMPEVVVAAKRYPVYDENIQSRKRGNDKNFFQIFRSRASRYLIWILVASGIAIASLLIFVKLQRNRVAHKQEKVMSQCCV